MAEVYEGPGSVEIVFKKKVIVPRSDCVEIFYC